MTNQQNRLIPTPDPHIERFEQMGFGLFLHWGLYSLLGRGEWAMNIHRIPKEDYYEPLMAKFTASGFDAKAIARTAKAAGMKYITLTSRHHDGFSLYDTRGLSPYDAPHSAAGRDLVKEFVDACHEEGILPVLYHTTIDWSVDSFPSDRSTYLQYLYDSVEILCTHYGKIGGLWFDGNWSQPTWDWELDKLYGMIRRLQPEALIVNNTGLDARGQVSHPMVDVVTFEQGRPTPLDRTGMPRYVAGEMCQTINDHWGVGLTDFKYKSLPDLIENLCACRKVGANYLLNIGPLADGSLPTLASALITEMGHWIKTCGSSVYDSIPFGAVPVSPATQEPITSKDFMLHHRELDSATLFVHNLPVRGDDHVTVPVEAQGEQYPDGVRCYKLPEGCGKVTSIKWHDNGQALEYRQEGEYLYVGCTPYPYGTSLVVRCAEITFDA